MIILATILPLKRSHIHFRRPMDPQAPGVAVVLLSWNGIGLIAPCLSSLLEQTYRNYRVLFVDNGSTDGSADFVRSTFPGVEVLALTPNCGFARGSNLGIAEVLKDPSVQYVLLLSIDTRVDAHFIAELVDAAGSDERIGSCQAKTLLMDTPTIIDAVGITFDKNGDPIQLGWQEPDNGAYDRKMEVFGANAGATLYRASMLREIELFDEDFFMYYEDVDLVLRARLAGWKCFFAPKAIVYHKHSHAYGNTSPFKEYLLNRNRYFYVVKDLPPAMVSIFLMRRARDLAGLIFRLAIRAALFDRKGMGLQASRIRPHLHAIAKLPAMFRKRGRIRSKRVISDRDLAGWFVPSR